jgi:hypothetical protein
MGKYKATLDAIVDKYKAGKDAYVAEDKDITDINSPAVSLDPLAGFYIPIFKDGEDNSNTLSSEYVEKIALLAEDLEVVFNQATENIKQLELINRGYESYLGVLKAKLEAELIIEGTPIEGMSFIQKLEYLAQILTERQYREQGVIDIEARIIDINNMLSNFPSYGRTKEENEEIARLREEASSLRELYDSEKEFLRNNSPAQAAKTKKSNKTKADIAEVEGHINETNKLIEAQKVIEKAALKEKAIVGMLQKEFDTLKKIMTRQYTEVKKAKKKAEEAVKEEVKKAEPKSKKPKNPEISVTEKGRYEGNLMTQAERDKYEKDNNINQVPISGAANKGEKPNHRDSSGIFVMSTPIINSDKIEGEGIMEKISDTISIYGHDVKGNGKFSEDFLYATKDG